MPLVDGASILARSLRSQGIKYMFGIVGRHTLPIAQKAQAEGIRFVAMRNEQAASFAACAIGYLTRKPGVCISVGGPGFVNVLSGMAFASKSCWPLLVVSGSVHSSQETRGAFQEFNQVDASRGYTKLAARPGCVENIPCLVEKAVRTSTYGRPGACYIDMTEDLIHGQAQQENISYPAICPAPPLAFADPENVKLAVNLVMQAKKPLVIIGKGAAYAGAEKELHHLIETTRLPFLPTPMGKGVLPETHELCVSAARRKALQEADVVILVGARLNWLLGFGLQPTFSANVKFVQVDLVPEEIGTNVQPAVPLVGDARAVIQQLNKEIENRSEQTMANISSWKTALEDECLQVLQEIQVPSQKDTLPISHFTAFTEIQRALPKECILTNEGSISFDLGITMLENHLPRHRLSCCTFASTGVGLGFAIAAALWCRDNHPNKQVVCVTGDSAFGFSGMEIETIVRYSLPVVIIVVNNNGNRQGCTMDMWEQASQEGEPTLTLHPCALLPNVRYDKMMEAAGGVGYLCHSREELRHSLRTALAQKSSASLINVMVDEADVKTLTCSWLTCA